MKRPPIPLLRVIVISLIVIIFALAAYFLVLMLPVIFGIWLADWANKPIASRDAYMATEYPDGRLNDWIDYWEGYLTG